MPTDVATLLPPNATALERDLEAATARVGGVPMPLAELWDPQDCPAQLLPWLAWALSVDRWDADWPLERKRAAVAGSIALHRIKGTRASVEAVLASFDPLLELIEWHQAAPPAAPHTFEVILPIAGPGIAIGGPRASAAFAEAIIREIMRVKPLREHLRFVQKATVEAAVGVVAVGRAAIFSRRYADLTTDATQPWADLLQDENGEPLQADDGTFIDGAA